MKITIKHNQTAIELEFTSAVTKDKVDVMKIISHVVNEFKSIEGNKNEAIIIQNKQQTGGTPIEKAKELIDKFSIVGLQQRNEGIQCAMIAVDEIVAELRDNDENFERETSHGVYVYWDVVKKEIQRQ